MSATSRAHSSGGTDVLYVAFDLGWASWKLAFSTCPGENPRIRSMRARQLEELDAEIARAKKRFGLPAEAPVRSCYEAGRDGFWLHRYLSARGITNVVVDAASIEVPRRYRRAKSDRLDATKLLGMLLRWYSGEKKVWSVVQVPTVAVEDRRQLHRELLTLKGERTEHVNRIKGLLASCGLVAEVDDDFPQQLADLRTWNEQPVPRELQQRLLREFARWQFVNRQIGELERQRLERIRKSPEEAMDQVRRLLRLRGIGVNSAWMFVMEFFSWRQFVNRRQVAALAGLTPTPYSSGDDSHEQGISKAGNRRLRTMAIEIAWCWLRYQPGSRLSQWYRERFGGGKSRLRRIGIVALARKLLVALWRYLEHAELPVGAVQAPKKLYGGARAELGR
jgi:transposase